MESVVSLAKARFIYHKQF